MKLMVPNFWYTKNILSLVLYPLSIVYRAISFCISYVPKNQIYKPKAKIIRVGNITMGGAGKTPVVLALTKMLQKNKIAIITRGYKGKFLGPIILNENHSLEEAGDEALLLLKLAPTCVSKDRLEGIKFLENLGYEIIITDDGMQDNRFESFCTIMVIDGHFGFGNKMLFPAGLLRETIVSGVKKSDFAVVIGEGEFDLALPMLRADLVSKASLNGQKVIAFAGIGNPNKFFHSVARAGGNIIERIAFADHYQYTKKDMEYLLSLGHQLITTEKDYVRIDEMYKDRIQTLPVELVFSDKNKLQKLLNL